MSHTLKAIHAQESRDAADRKPRTIVEDLRAAQMYTAVDLVERSVSETLTYYAFPDIHWQKIRTTDEIDKPFIFCWICERLLVDAGYRGHNAPTITRSIRQARSAGSHRRSNASCGGAPPSNP